MNWFAWPFGKGPATQDAPQALIADIEKRGRQYLDEADNGKWVYPACKRAASDAGADKSLVCDHTRLEAFRYLLMVPRGEFRLLAEPDSQAAIARCVISAAFAGVRMTGVLVFGARFDKKRCRNSTFSRVRLLPGAPAITPSKSSG